jgi:ATP-dependent DNA helicase RecQ
LSSTRLKNYLKHYWGYDDFRYPQFEIIQSILSGRDTIALLPTGGGKSLCYQLPALAAEGKVLVISPLISLMQDQVSQLASRDIYAKAIHSGMSAEEIDAIFDNLVHGPLKILYISPERVQTELFLTRFYLADISFIAVDEAHCISQWGHDFRPAYTALSKIREIKPKLPIMALTATATPYVVSDICTQLQLKDQQIFSKSFARDNISFIVMKNDNKIREVIKILAKLEGTGIIYQRSRVNCIKIAEALSSKGYHAIAYHGGMTHEERQKIQENWTRGKHRIIVATNAFGMGIDKSDVRFVIHLDLPASIEEYYQESGRAGRDGRPAYAISIVNNRDILAAQGQLQTAYPTLQEIASIYNSLLQYLKVAVGGGAASEFYFDITDFARRYKIYIAKIYNTLKILERQGWIILNEALRHPSLLVVVADPREIHNIYEENDIRYILLCEILRMYESVFIEKVPIQEDVIAARLKIKYDHTITLLKVLQQDGMIEYDPSLSLPKLTLLLDRPDIKSFKIDEAKYLEDKQRAQDRLTSMISYFTEDQCRQSMILKYFGETIDHKCGKCDICRGSADTNYSTTEFKAVLSALTNEKTRQLNEASFVSQWPMNKRKRVIQILKDLESQAIIQRLESGLIVNLLKEDE